MKDNNSTDSPGKNLRILAGTLIAASSLLWVYASGQSSGHKVGIAHARWESQKDIVHLERRYSADFEKADLFDRLSLTHLEKIEDQYAKEQNPENLVRMGKYLINIRGYYEQKPVFQKRIDTALEGVVSSLEKIAKENNNKYEI